MNPRRVFVAGSTGAVGRVLLRQAGAWAVDCVPHLRPGRQAAPSGDAAVFDLADGDALLRAMTGCTTVLQLIGTRRARFAAGDTYQTSDVGTTALLATAAARTGVDHFVLLSSVGAGRPVGAYLRAKAQAESIVRESGLPFTVVRPSLFVGEGHAGLPGLETLTRWLGLPALRPIRVENLAAAILMVARDREPLGAVIEGASLWQVVEAASRDRLRRGA